MACVDIVYDTAARTHESQGSSMGTWWWVSHNWTAPNPEAVHNCCEGACYRPMVKNTAGVGETNDKRGAKVGYI